MKTLADICPAECRAADSDDILCADGARMRHLVWIPADFDGLNQTALLERTQWLAGVLATLPAAWTLTHILAVGGTPMAAIPLPEAPRGRELVRRRNDHLGRTPGCRLRHWLCIETPSPTRLSRQEPEPGERYLALARELDDLVTAWLRRLESRDRIRAADHEEALAITGMVLCMDPEAPDRRRAGETQLNLAAPFADLDIAVARGRGVLSPGLPEARDYALLSLAGAGGEEQPPAPWVRGADAPIRKLDHYLLVTRWRPYGLASTRTFFANQRRNAARSALSLGSMLGMKRQQSSERVSNEIDSAEWAETLWGHFEQTLAVPVEQLPDARAALDNASILHITESFGLAAIHRAIQPGAPLSPRARPATVHQAANLIPAYCPSAGDADALLEFKTPDGFGFGFSPDVGGRRFCLIIGPTRRGKSFLLNMLAGMEVARGARLVALDADDGSESLAHYWSQDGDGPAPIVRFTTNEAETGLNPFQAAGDHSDQDFQRHCLELLRVALAITGTHWSEQLAGDLAAGIASGLQLDLSRRGLGAVAAHCSSQTRTTLQPWCQGGPYATLFDWPTDCWPTAGEVPVRVANIKGLRSQPQFAQLVYAEIFHRVRREAFAEASRAHRFVFSIDEGHIPLGLELFRKAFEIWIRTANKYNCTTYLSTQSPVELARLDCWPVLRDSVSTYVFTANDAADAELYAGAFQLENGQIETIRHLEPAREVLVIQPENRLTRTIRVDADPYQYVLATSTPAEVELFRNNLRHLSFDRAVETTARELGL